MKRHFVIECDTEYNSVFVYEVSRDFSSTVDYHREPVVEAVFHDFLSPKFYGKLDAILFSKERIENAPPITPQAETPETRVIA